MRRYKILVVVILVLLLVILVKQKQEDPNISGELVSIDTEEETLEENQEITLGEPSRKERETKTEQDLLRELQQKQTDIMLERTGIVKQKRETLDKLIDRDVDFEDKKFYQKALGVLKEKEAELNVGIRRLETRIRSLRGMDENKETVEALENLIGELDKEKDDYLKKLKELGARIVQIRKDWLDLDFSLEEVRDYRDDIHSLEIEETGLFDRVMELVVELEDKKERVANSKGETLPGGKSDLYAERARIEEELKVVNNAIVDEFLASKEAEGEELEAIKRMISELDEREEELNYELAEVDKKIASS